MRRRVNGGFRIRIVAEYDVLVTVEFSKSGISNPSVNNIVLKRLHILIKFGKSVTQRNLRRAY